MSRAFILSPKVSDMSAISVSSAIEGAPGINLLRARPHLFWRSTDSTPYVVGNFGSPKPINTLLLGWANGREDDTFRLRLATSESNLTASPGFDSNTANPSGVTLWPPGDDLSGYALPHRVWTFPTQTYQWYRLDFSSTSDYVQAARVILGTRIEPATSVQPKWSINGSEQVAETIDMGGEESPRIMGTKRAINVVWHDLLEAEREEIYQCLLERGSAKDIVLAIEPSEGLYSMSRVYVGRVKQMFSFQQAVFAGNDQHRYTVSLVVSEMAPIEML